MSEAWLRTVLAQGRERGNLRVAGSRALRCSVSRSRSVNVRRSRLVRQGRNVKSIKRAARPALKTGSM